MHASGLTSFGTLRGLLLGLLATATFASSQPAATRYVPDPSFVSPALSGPAWDIRAFPLADGGALVAGSFTTASGVAAQGWSRLDAAGRLVKVNLEAQLAALGNTVGAPLAQLADGSVLFPTQIRRDAISFLDPVELRRVHLNGDVDPAFRVAFTTSSAQSVILERVTPLNDGRLFVGGQFAAAGGHPTRNAAFIRSDGTVDTGFSSAVAVLRASLDRNGQVIGANQGSRGTVPNPREYALVRLTPQGGLEEIWHITRELLPVTVVADHQNRLVMGAMRTFGGIIISAVDTAPIPTATADPAEVMVYRATPGAEASLILELKRIPVTNNYGTQYSTPRIQELFSQPDGSLLLVGEFPQPQFPDSATVLRLTPADEVDTAFSPPIPSGHEISRLQPAPNGWLATTLRHHNGVLPYPGLLSLTALLEPRPGFVPELRRPATPSRIYPLPAGAVLLEGAFIPPGGDSAQRYAILRSGGLLDYVQVPRPDHPYLVAVRHVGRDGFCYLGFSEPASPSEVLTPSLERYSTRGVRDAGFGRVRPGLDHIESVYVDSDHRLLIGGRYQPPREPNVPLSVEMHVKRFLPTGAPDPTFQFRQRMVTQLLRIDSIADLPEGGPARYAILGDRTLIPVDDRGDLSAPLPNGRYRLDATRLVAAGNDTYAVGTFTSALGVYSPGVLRLNQQGLPDSHWLSGLSPRGYTDLQALPDRRLLVTTPILATVTIPPHPNDSFILSADGLIDANESLPTSLQTIALDTGHLVALGNDRRLTRYRLQTRPALDIAVVRENTARTTPVRLEAILPSPITSGLAWSYHGNVFPDETKTSLEIVYSRRTPAGIYTLTQTLPDGQVVSASKRVLWDRDTDPRISNASARSFIGQGERLQIVGFVVQPSHVPSTAPVLLRAIRSDLGQFGLLQPAQSTRVRLFVNGRDQPSLYYPNSSTSESVENIAFMAGAFPVTNLNLNPSGLLQLYSVMICTQHAWAENAFEEGVGLMELFLPAEAVGSPGLSPEKRVMNFSCRAEAGSGERTLIVGFVIEGDAPLRVLIQALGPTLRNAGLENATTDPTLTLYRGFEQVAFNDNWQQQANPAALDATRAQIGASPVAPGTTDAALLLELAPGVYTALFHAKSSPGGIGLLELYDASAATP